MYVPVSVCLAAFTQLLAVIRSPTRDHCDDEEIRDCFYNDENWERYDRCIELANKKQKSPIQIALAWVLNQSFNIAAVIGPEKLEELDSSIEGSEIILSQDEVKYLNLEVDHYE